MYLLIDRWSGRNHREKINVHVTFDEELDMTPFISADDTTQSLYQLSAVVIHHGRGFSSGHYTAYCWNDEASKWMVGVWVLGGGWWVCGGVW